MRERLMDFMSKELGVSFHQFGTNYNPKFGYHGWDSLKHVDMILAIEDEFGISFTMDELAEGTDSFNEILCLLEKKLGPTTPEEK